MTEPRLYEFQREGVEFVRECFKWLDGAAIFDEPGLGKTPQAIRAGDGKQPVVVVTLGNVKFNWRNEYRTWMPHYATHVAQGPRGFRWPRPGEVLITNHEALPPAASEVLSLRSKLVRLSLGTRSIRERRAVRAALAAAEDARSMLTEPFTNTLLIVDEAHREKNREAACTLRLREMSVRVRQRGGKTLLLTANPLVNERRELWTVLEAAGLGTALWGSEAAYEADWDVPGAVAEKLRLVSIRRSRREVLPQLPHITRETRVVPIGSALRAHLDWMTTALQRRGVSVETATLEEIRAAAAQADVAKHVARVRWALALAKYPAARDFVAEQVAAGVPLAVFCCHRAPIDLLARRKDMVTITGDESDEEKQAAADAFQGGQANVVGMTYRAGGAGANLFRAWRGLMIDTPWTPADVEQAEGRLLRIGQKASGVLITRFVADHPIERRVDFLVSEKVREIEQSVSASTVPGTPA